MKINLLLASALAVVSVSASEMVGKVIRVSEGDTITVLVSSNEQYKIRLDKIDAPEKKQSFGEKSKQHLSEMVFGKDVRLDWKKIDNYGRILGEVYVGTTNANLQMVKDGMAWHYKLYDKTEEYATAEIAARKKRIGLWGDEKPIEPWFFRRGTASRPRTKAKTSEVPFPLIAGYKAGDVITNGICKSSGRAFENGVWSEGRSLWALPNRESAFVITNGNVSVGATAAGIITEITLREDRVIDPETADMRKELTNYFLQLQESIVRYGMFPKECLGMDAASSVDLDENSSCDIHQTFLFANAIVRLYACFRANGPYGKNTLSREVRIQGRRSQKRKSSAPIRAQVYTLKDEDRVDIGSFEGLRLGQMIDMGDERRRMVLTNAVFGCKRMSLGLTPLNRVWEINSYGNNCQWPIACDCHFLIGSDHRCLSADDARFQTSQ